jgi:hypothetical protein
MKNVLDKSCGENRKISRWVTFLKKIVPFMRNAEKYSRAGDAK